jgi:hypothetical protein
MYIYCIPGVILLHGQPSCEMFPKLTDFINHNALRRIKKRFAAGDADSARLYAKKMLPVRENFLFVNLRLFPLNY